MLTVAPDRSRVSFLVEFQTSHSHVPETGRRVV